MATVPPAPPGAGQPPPAPATAAPPPQPPAPVLGKHLELAGVFGPTVTAIGTYYYRVVGIVKDGNAVIEGERVVYRMDTDPAGNQESNEFGRVVFHADIPQTGYYGTGVVHAELELVSTGQIIRLQNIRVPAIAPPPPPAPPTATKLVLRNVEGKVNATDPTTMNYKVMVETVAGNGNPTTSVERRSASGPDSRQLRARPCSCTTSKFMAYAMPRQVRRSADRGFSSQAFSSELMWTANSCFETVCGSRHGMGRIRTGAALCGSCRAAGRITCSAVAIGSGSHRLRLHFELGIAQSAHFRQVQAIQFRLGADALADHESR